MATDDEDPAGGVEVTIPGPLYTEIFGVGSDMLTCLRVLQEEALSLRLPLLTWRAAFAALTAGYGLSQEAVNALRDEVAEAYFEAEESAHPLATDADGERPGPAYSKAHYRQLLRDLSGLVAPPSDAEVRVTMAGEIANLRKLAGTSEAARETHIRLAATFEGRRAAWLHEIEGPKRSPYGAPGPRRP